MDLRVTVGGFEFKGDGIGEGYFIGPDGFNGWFDSVDIRTDDVAVPQGDGSFDLPVFRQSRIVSIDGWLWGDSPSAARDLRRQLSGILGTGESATMTVYEGDADDGEHGVCRLAAKPIIEVHGYELRWAEFQIQLRFPDPIRYGKYLTSGAPSASIVMYHYGTVPARPMITITGTAANGYSVTGPTGVYQVTAPLVSGQPHTIDMVTGILRVNGVVTYGQAPIAEIIKLPPHGESFLVTVLPISGGTPLGVLSFYEPSI